MPMNLSMLNVFSKLSFLQSPASSANLVSYPYCIHTYSVYIANQLPIHMHVVSWSLLTMDKASCLAVYSLLCLYCTCSVYTVYMPTYSVLCLKPAPYIVSYAYCACTCSVHAVALVLHTLHRLLKPYEIFTTYIAYIVYL